MLCSFSDQRSGLDVLKPVNGVRMLSVVQESNGLVGPCRVLRPRMREGFVRKKRCFYEVNLRDFNPVTIVKWRIRVYWPMDCSWYIGSVKEYDPVIHKHHVRYDDQEEEWLDLHNERFKLLLFPSDVPNKSNWNENKNPNLLSGENLEEEREEDSDATIEKIVETKPVKSLLTCSLYQLKPNPLPVMSNSNNFEVKANKNSVKNDRFLIVYSRKQFWNSKENLSSIGTILVDATRILPSHCHIVLKLNLPLAMFAGRVLIGSHFWHWHSLFFLYNGALITMSPLVKLERMVSDNSFGGKYFLLEVCLRSAVSVLCFLVGMFKMSSECNGKASKVPIMSITFAISGLHGYKGQAVIAEQDSSSGLVDPLLAYQPIFSGVNPMMFFMNKKSSSKPPSFLLSSHHEMIPVSSFPQNSQPTTLLCVSGDDNDKDGSATKSINVDDKDATASSPPATYVVEGLVDQISHVIHSSTPTAPRFTAPHQLWPSSDQIGSRKPCSDTSSQPHSSKCSKPNYSDYALTCCANVLVTADNRGWRECGAHVVLEFDEQVGARLCVQFFRETKYFYRANQVMQPGSTNRYNHAMMWRGGRDWSLEFIERNQWFIFKEMYVECYNRNMRAASVKNIPTPGVLIVEGDNMVGFRQPFVRGLGYIRQVGSDIDVALDPSRVIYEMDSEDEEWVLGFNGERELTEDLFERIMDKCEKLAYVNNCTEFTKEQIEELMGDVGPMEVVKEVAGYWITKRMKKGMSLIRHLQPPLWMHYQKLLDEWEASVRKIKRAPHSALSKAPPTEKPPMFAFCLRPLSLQLERPQKKLLPSSRSHTSSRKSGRRLSARASRDRVASVSRLNHPKRTRVPASQFSDNHQAVSYLSHNQTVLTGKRKHPASFDMPDRMNPTSLPSDNLGFLKEYVEEFEARDAQNAALHAVNMARLKRQKTQLLVQKAGLASSDMPDRMNPTSLLSDNLGFLKEDVEEFKVRDAQDAALHAANMARLKREKAELLMQKADLAMYKVRSALMIADAIKSSTPKCNGTA